MISINFFMFLGGLLRPKDTELGIPSFKNNVMGGELPYALEGHANRRSSCDPDASLKIVETRFRVTPKATGLKLLSGHRHAPALCRGVPLNMKRVHRHR